MWKQPICLGVSDQFGLSSAEQVRLFRQAGFEATFVNWNAELDLAAFAATVKQHEMTFQSVHAPFKGMAAVWGEDDEAAAAAIAELKTCLLDCIRNEVPIMVAHAFIGFEDHNPTDIGIERLSELVRTAEGSGTKIAFENTEGMEYLERVMTAFPTDPVGFCYDSGHEMCYNYSEDMLAKYGDRLLCTHLNDNLGIHRESGKITYRDDLHLLPFDGIADWDDIAARIRKTGFDGILTFELNTKSKRDRYDNDKYAAMPIQQYIAEVYARACRVAAKLQKP